MRRSLRNPWYRASIRTAASAPPVAGVYARDDRGTSRIDDTEAATVLAALVETTGGRWPDRPRRITRLLARLDVAGHHPHMAEVIHTLATDPCWPPRVREIAATSADW
ncbi:MULTISPECIES: hypothetical protein [Rhodococcus]|uniref:hypothetical protein n=1 Tax=Rhodococcus TaxID=1827 RepID=UPI000AE7B8A1|nr:MULTISPECIES: hypothetical protein [Rhodococcus]QHE73681.1 hypothetical protein GFS60_07345 [Rhodococcus sp. WAY2]